MKDSLIVSRIAFDIFSCVAVLIFIGLRLWHQRSLRREIERSDIWANTSIIISTTMFVTWVALSTKTRIALLAWERADEDSRGVAPPITEKGHFLHFMGGFAYVTILWLIKSAFLATYYRLIPALKTRVRMALYFTTGFTAMTYVANMLLHGLYCLPIQTNWTSGPHNCTTFRSVPSLTANTFTNVATDLLLLGLPLFILKTLKLQPREGFALTFVFLVGIASTTASVLRWAFIYSAYRQEQDVDGAIYKIEIIKVWTTAEISTATIAFCLPVLRSLVRSFWVWEKRNGGAREEDGRKIFGGGGAPMRCGDSGVDAATVDEEEGGAVDVDVEKGANGGDLPVVEIERGIRENAVIV
ncbi:uncharacterized protein LAJ45_10608 [Morchella importuna]|uniref:uncharacterized protein n=1 Tax=Morchella importuna TaxID=1174673 RepID=UPI001E8E401D|nr:uncharacterized protein LAJ45_10608 [Morchella importuna]KAH8145328.1 hypothetical protein LAJ45_10608 [Morchella importuna]